MQTWLSWLIVGVVSVVFGVVVLGNATAASIAVTTLTGLLFAATGIFQIVVGWSEEGTGHKIVTIGLGALMLLLGVSFMFNPLDGVISLALLVTILIGAGGILRLAMARRMKDTRFYMPMLISGALSLLLVAYILLNFATVGPQLLGILLGIELIFNGTSLIVLAFFLRAASRQHQA
ncbi:MAG: DUF308 domain-containing protein [Pseudomonadota bacterium]